MKSIVHLKTSAIHNFFSNASVFGVFQFKKHPSTSLSVACLMSKSISIEPEDIVRCSDATDTTDAIILTGNLIHHFPSP